MTTRQVTYWPYPSYLHDDGTVWMMAKCHTSFKQYVGTWLTSELGFVPWIGLSFKEFIFQLRFVVRRQQNHRCDCLTEACVQNLADIWASLLCVSDGAVP